MKKPILIVVVSLFSICSYCQSAIEKNSLSFAIGPSIPLGNYAKTDFSKNLSGFAKKGETVNITFNHTIHKNIGIAAMLYGQRNGLNTKTFSKQLSQTEFFAGNGPGYPRSYSNWETDKTSWRLASLLAGIIDQFSIGKTEKISLVTKVLIGIAYAHSPEVNANSKTDTSYAIYTQSKASAFGLSYSASAGLRYKLNKKTSFLVSAEYFGTTRIHFKNVTAKILATNGGITVPKIYSFSNSVGPIVGDSFRGTTQQPFSPLNINFGISFTL